MLHYDILKMSRYVIFLTFVTFKDPVNFISICLLGMQGGDVKLCFASGSEWWAFIRRLRREAWLWKAWLRKTDHGVYKTFDQLFVKISASDVYFFSLVITGMILVSSAVPNV